MGYLLPTNDSAPAVAAPAATTTEPIDKLIQLLKDLAPWILMAIVVYLIIDHQRSESRRELRKNPRWQSLPSWESKAPAAERREILQRQLAKDGYKTVLKRLVAMGNLTGDKSAIADSSWLQQEFGA